MNSGQFEWKTSKDIPKCLQEWCCSSLFPWSQSCVSAWAGNVRDTLLLEVSPLFSHLHPELVLISGAETCIWQLKEQQDCQIVLKALRCSRVVRLSQKPWCAPVLSDCPKGPDMLQAAWSRLTGTASHTTLEHPELKLSLLERSKVWEQRSPEGNPAATKKTHVCSLVFAVTRRWLWNSSREVKKMGASLVVAKCSPWTALLCHSQVAAACSPLCCVKLLCCLVLL